MAMKTNLQTQLAIFPFLPGSYLFYGFLQNLILKKIPTPFLHAGKKYTNLYNILRGRRAI